MSEKTPDLGTAWRLLDEARAELSRVTAERDDLSAKLADAVSPTARDFDNAAEILKLRDERDRLAAELEAVHTALGWADHQRAGWRFRAGLPMTWELSQVTMIGVRCDAAADITELAAERDDLRDKLADETYDNAPAELLTAMSQVDYFREMVREILREVELGTLGQHTPAATTRTLARTAEWRQRAGLEG